MLKTLVIQIQELYEDTVLFREDMVDPLLVPRENPIVQDQFSGFHKVLQGQQFIQVGEMTVCLVI